MKSPTESRLLHVVSRLYWVLSCAGAGVIALVPSTPWWLRVPVAAYAFLAGAMAWRASSVDSIESMVITPATECSEPNDGLSYSEHAQLQAVATQPKDSNPNIARDRT